MRTPGEPNKRSWQEWVRNVRDRRRRQRVPSFFIIGPPRTGTSWLHEIFKRRAVLPKGLKETRFFDVNFHRGKRWYLAHFPRNQQGRVGEVAPTYFSSAEARRRIKELVPDAKIICTFRDPVERVLSLYRVKRAYGMIPWSFEQAMAWDAELTESSRYATYLKAWQADFGPEHVLPTIYDDLRDRPQLYVNRVADFIGVPRFSLDSQELKGVHMSEKMTHPRSYYRTRSATAVADWLKARRFGNVVGAIKNSPISKLFLGGGVAFSGPSDELSLVLQEFFRREVEELETLLGRDLSAWKPSREDLQFSDMPFSGEFPAAA